MARTTTPPRALATTSKQRTGTAPMALWLAAWMAACGDGGADSASAEGTDSTGSSPTTTATMSEPTTTTATNTDPSTGPSTSTTASTDSDDTTGTTESAETSVGPLDSSESSSGETGIGDCHPLLVEVFYDVDGPSDDLLQWVKIYNPCNGPFDLANHALGYSGFDALDGLAFGNFDLGAVGVMEAGDCGVVGASASGPANGDPDLILLVDFMPGLNTAERTGAGIGLFDVDGRSIDATTVPIDAVIYGPNNVNGLIDETGQPVAAPHVAASGPGGSLVRTGEASTWVTALAPTPNVCPPF